MTGRDPTRHRARLAGRRFILAMLIAPAAPTAAAQSSDLIAYGRHLAASCAPCHDIDLASEGGTFAGSGRIAGLAPEDFLRRLERQEREGANALMRQIALELGLEERAALAAYLEGKGAQ